MIGIERIRDDDLTRFDTGDLGGHIAALAFADAEFRGRDVDPGERKAILVGRQARSRQRQQVVIACASSSEFSVNVRRYQPHHIAADDALGAALARFGRVLELFAYGNAMPKRDQPVQIFVGALDRDAAHGNVFAEMPAAFGQHDAERA